MPALSARRRVEAVFAKQAQGDSVVVRYRCVAFMFQPLD